MSEQDETIQDEPLCWQLQLDGNVKCVKCKDIPHGEPIEYAPPGTQVGAVKDLRGDNYMVDEGGVV